MTDVPVVRRSLVVFGCGPKESGKSTFLYRHFTSKQPRVLTIDVAGEAADFNASVIQSYGYADTMRALRYAATGGRRWHVAAILEPDDVPAVIEVLAPRVRPDRPGFARAVGGLAVECGEIQYLLPNRGTPRPWKNAVALSRHYLLTLLTASQRPALCDRIITSQANVLFSMRHNEPDDIAYLAAYAPAFREIIPNLAQHHVAYLDRTSMQMFVADERGRVTRRLDGRTGAEIAAGSSLT